MKQFIKPFVYYLLSILVFSSCEHDESLENNTSPSNYANQLPFTVKKVNKKDVLQNNILVNSLNRVNNASDQDSNFRLIYSQTHDFYIDTEQANFLESADGIYHSYTFSIIRDYETDKVENLVLSLNKNNEYDTYIVSYNITKNEKERIILQEDVNLEDKVFLQVLEDFEESTVFNKTIYVDETEGVVTCWEPEYGSSDGTGWDEIVGWDQVDCPWDSSTSGGGGGNDSSNTSGGNTNDSSGSGNNTNTNIITVTGWGSTGGGSGGGTSGGNYAPYTSINVLSDAEKRVKLFFINLTPEQSDYLSNHPDIKAVCKEFLLQHAMPQDIDSPNSLTIDEAEDLVNNAISELMTYDESNYPGIEDQFPFQWWEDDAFIEENISFEMNEYDNLTEDEKRLVKIFPLPALIILNNKEPTYAETLNRFGNNGINDKADAFRHAFFNAMNANDVGGIIAILFSTAHESEVPPNLILEAQMDIFNNSVGINIGVEASIFVSDQELSNSAYEALLNGLLVYLFPINYSDPNFWDNPNTTEPNDGNHGITVSTQIITTDQ